MGQTHSFSVGVAVELGVNAAILLQSIGYWCDKNKANGKHEHDGLYWTYNSTRAWGELYPYIGKSAITAALGKLEERGYIRTGNYNHSAYDRTKWYAITSEGREALVAPIDRNREMDSTETQNRNGEIKRPIPNTYTVTDPVKDIKANEPPYASIVAYLNERTGAKYRPTTPKTRERIRARWAEGFREEDFRAVIDGKVADWGKDEKMARYLRPETLFGPKFEGYLNEPRTKREKEYGFDASSYNYF